jgi:hypothetical protein
MREYKDMLEIVTKMENASPKQTVNYVKMDFGVGEPLTIETPRSYPQLLGEVSKTDSSASSSPKHGRFQQTQVQVQPQKAQPIPPQQLKPEAKIQVQPKDLEKKNEQQGKGWFGGFGSSQPKPKIQPTPTVQQKAEQPRAQIQPVAAVQPMPKPTLPPAQVQPTKSLEKSAGEELIDAMKDASIKPMPTAQPVYVQPAKNLVLPTLSLTDQVVELDKITENIKQKRFDNYQMSIVKQEVEGLDSFISSQPKPASPPPGYEQDLLDLRKARLTEAITLIHGS